MSIFPAGDGALDGVLKLKRVVAIMDECLSVTKVKSKVGVPGFANLSPF